ncbi:AraC family transcriptional regulator [Geovibrio thiophilus]|uniref:AraC family transcriptional regulator n=1 Tax=Geovibrio thiophilus TaxID=139438 RepID=A0A3R5Z0I2_9BACT|nr:AraC family transcriptional regulator [Geovibrio thiophilus]QAR34039.1 AraC family transcriptional regulator [Geovibrio thiophilus]
MLSEISVSINESVKNTDNGAVRPMSSPYLKYAKEYLITPEIGYYSMDVPSGEELKTGFQTANSSLGIIFCLGGSSVFTISKNGLTYEYTLRQGECSIAYMPYAAGISAIDSRKRYRAVNMFIVPLRVRNHSFGHPMAESFLQEITRTAKDSIFLTKGNITKDILKILQELISTKASGFSYRNLDISRLYELVMLTVESLNTKKQFRQKNILQPEDINLILNAGRLITENLSNPPTLVSLAKSAGLNLFKLKNGFKEVFGTTVNGFITDKRMEKAKVMLESGDYSVSNIAWDLGYTNVSHFIELFRRQYGMTPGKLLSEQRSRSVSKLISSARQSII